MTTKPELTNEGSFLPGLAAVALFVVFAAVFLTASFPAPLGFGEGAAITTSLGAAMFDIAPSVLMGEGETAVPSEGFLVAFIVIAIALDAALDGALMLARREESGENVSVHADDSNDTAVAADGGEEA